MSTNAGLSGHGSNRNIRGYLLTGVLAGVVGLSIGGVAGFSVGRVSRETTPTLENLSVETAPAEFQCKTNKLGFPRIVAGFRDGDGNQVGPGVVLEGVGPTSYEGKEAYKNIQRRIQQRLTLRGPKPLEEKEDEKSEVKVEKKDDGTSITIQGGATFNIQGPATLNLGPDVNYVDPSQDSTQPHSAPLEPLQAPQYHQPTPGQIPGPQPSIIPGPAFESNSYNSLQDPDSTKPQRQASYHTKDLVKVCSTQTVCRSSCYKSTVSSTPLDVGGWRASSD